MRKKGVPVPEGVLLKIRATYERQPHLGDMAVAAQHEVAITTARRVRLGELAPRGLAWPPLPSTVRVAPPTIPWEKIREQYAQGQTLRSLGEQFRLSYETVRQIVRGEWPRLPAAANYAVKRGEV